jgi:hypothetical protein
VYPQSFLGSDGLRVGKYYGGFDNFSILYPKFETKLTVEIPEQGLFRSGSFYDTMFDLSKLGGADYWTVNPYSAYEHANNGFTAFSNDGAPADKRFLLMGDSYGNVPFCYLALCARRAVDIDPRLYSGNFADFFAAYRPDVLIFLTNPKGVAEIPTAMTFFEGAD